MPQFASQQRLADLLIDPREDLDIELKNWLDLRSCNDDKANFAKAVLALANHGGGFILLGLEETDTGAVEAPGRPASFDAYSQDHINGIVQNYADPPFHCTVQVAASPAGSLFPIISIPGGHRVPVRARRSGPHGNIVGQNDIYIRKPGPRSETPQSGQEWDGLLARCLANRRDEMFDQIRDLVSGSVAAVAATAEPARLDQWIEGSFARWTELVAALPSDAPARCSHGFYWAAYQIDGELRSIDLAQLPALLQASVTRHTGWPPFWYPTRPGIAPYPIDGCVECWLPGDPDGGAFSDPAHADFWRISPDGFAFLLRGYQEDGTDTNAAQRGRVSITPGTLFDVTLPVWRIGEIMLQAARLASNLADGPATINFVAHYEGLSGRTLTSMSGRRALWDNRIARQNSIDLKTVVDASSVGPNLPEIVQPLLSPLYSLFDFYELPASLVSEELARLRSGQF